MHERGQVPPQLTLTDIEPRQRTDAETPTRGSAAFACVNHALLRLGGTRLSRPPPADPRFCLVTHPAVKPRLLL